MCWARTLKTKPSALVSVPSDGSENDYDFEPGDINRTLFNMQGLSATCPLTIVEMILILLGYASIPAYIRCTTVLHLKLGSVNDKVFWLPSHCCDKNTLSKAAWGEKGLFDLHFHIIARHWKKSV